MKLKYNFVIDEIAGQKVAVVVGEEATNCILKLNDTAAFIMELLKNDVSLEEISSSILQNFEVEDKAQMENMVNNFLQKLKDAGLLI